MGDRTAASEPKGVLVQLLAHALRLQRVLTAIKRLQHRQRPAHELIVAEDAAEPDQALVGVNSNQSVNAILGPKFIAPSAFRRRSTQTGTFDLADFHKLFASNRSEANFPESGGAGKLLAEQHRAAIEG